jgi:hypothetical protein
VTHPDDDQVKSRVVSSCPSICTVCMSICSKGNPVPKASSVEVKLRAFLAIELNVDKWSTSRRGL